MLPIFCVCSFLYNAKCHTAVLHRNDWNASGESTAKIFEREAPHHAERWVSG